jgi:hypothetical protein
MSEVEPAVAQAVEKRDCGKAKVEDWNVKREASMVRGRLRGPEAVLPRQSNRARIERRSSRVGHRF